MKISKLLENPTPSSTSALNGGGYGGQAPQFGRDPEILEDEQIDETSAGATGSGSVGGGAPTDLGIQRRSKGSIFQGVKTSKKFVNSPVTEGPLKDKSMDALSKAKDNIALKRTADLEQWEKDFRDSMARKLKQRPVFEPVPVSKPGEKHSVLKARMANLDMAIKKQEQVDMLAQKLEKIGRLTPAMLSAIDTRLLIRQGPKDAYQALNKKLDSALELLQNNLNTYKIARKKPKAMREDGITAGINKYYDDRASGALDPRTGQRQPYLQQWALKVNGKVDGSNIFRSEQAAMLARSALLRKNPNVQVGLVTRGGLAEEEFNGEYDDEAGMADNNLETMRRAVDGIDNVISSGDNLPEWCQEKIAVAKSMLVTVWDYMRSAEEIGNDEEIVKEAGSNPRVELSPNYPNYETLIGEFIGMKNNRARFLIVDAKVKPGLRETEKIFKARTTNTPISIEISKVRNRAVVESELSEESLLAKALAGKLELFNKADDRELGSKPEDREIITKEQAAHTPTMMDRLEKEISTRMSKEHPEVIQQYGKQIVQDAITNVAIYHRHMRGVTSNDIDNMINEVIQQLNRHLQMREEKQRLDPACWKGYKKQGTKMKGGVRVNNCVPK